MAGIENLKVELGAHTCTSEWFPQSGCYYSYKWEILVYETENCYGKTKIFTNDCWGRREGEISAVSHQKPLDSDSCCGNKTLYDSDDVSVLQLVKHTQENSRLDVIMEGKKKLTYQFENAHERENFCLQVRQMKTLHSQETDVDNLSVFIGTWNMGKHNPCLLFFFFFTKPWPKQLPESF